MPDPEPEPETWTYGGDPEGSTKDELRLLVGDTDTNDQLLTDAEVAYFLARSASVALGAAKACRAIASKLSRQVDYTIGDLSEKLRQRADGYLALAAQLEADESRSSFGSGSASVSFITGSSTTPDSLRMGDEPIDEGSLDRDDAPDEYRGLDK
jgi:hypothetical protein